MKNIQVTVSFKHFFIGILGNICDHFDHALFGLMVPYIAPLFFKNLSPISGLICAYCLTMVGILGRPIGAFIFGVIGDRFGRKRALFFTLLGMALITTLMGALPTFDQLGILSPILLGIARLFQSIFAAGETTGGAIFVLEHAQKSQKNLFSALYGSSSIFGVLFASFTIHFFASTTDMQSFWRIPFFLGGGSALCALILRFFGDEPLPLSREKKSFKEHLQSIYLYRMEFLLILIASGFSYLTFVYGIALTNAFLPLITSISQVEATKLHSYLLILDLCLLPFFGLLAKRLQKERLMFWCSLSCACLAFPLLSLLKGTDFFGAFLIHGIFMLLGVGFAAPYYHWAQEKVPSSVRYTVVALASALGTQCIGSPSVSISLWIYKQTGSVSSSGIYFVIIALFATWAIAKSRSIFEKTRREDLAR